ncbi:protein MAIN-LIKE 1-like [Diospyros lotus]|uniref:protein MAIN-LIKE 1-like n=1 Tax=Diospyros lotus TaxID=55363 RepID=UPI00224F5CD3|nr:protein MAIN-LIKE 1-like [Diospyros lotus]
MARTRGGGVEGARQRPTASTRRRRGVEGHDGHSVADTSISEAHISEQPGTLDSSPPSAPEQPSTSAPEQPSTSAPEQPSTSAPDDTTELFLGGPEDSSILKSFKNHVAVSIWAGEERCVLKCNSHGQRIPDWPLANQQRIYDIVVRSQLAPLIESTYRFVNPTVVSAFSERWQPETNTFHLPFGEMTLTLDDVATILKIPVSGSPVSIPHLTDLSISGTHAWGAACLAYLYRQLGITSRRDVKGICGYLILLEAWIYEHFPLTRSKHNLSYTDELPRAHRWLLVREYDSLQSLRERLDDLTEDQVIWTPYRRYRTQHPLHEIAFFSGCLKCGGVIEPYHPERVLRQFGHKQNIPPPPLSPIEAKRGRATATYKVIYNFINDSWSRWDFHLLPAHRRGGLALVPWECSEDYLAWYHRITHRVIQNPTNRSGFDRGDRDRVTLADVCIMASLSPLRQVISGGSTQDVDAWRRACLQVYDILTIRTGSSSTGSYAYTVFREVPSSMVRTPTVVTSHSAVIINPPPTSSDPHHPAPNPPQETRKRTDRD